MTQAGEFFIREAAMLYYDNKQPPAENNTDEVLKKFVRFLIENGISTEAVQKMTDFTPEQIEEIIKTHK